MVLQQTLQISMLNSVSISNFKSYGVNTTIGFCANRSNAFSETLHVNPYQTRSPRITRYNVLFGPNGSGKSNLLQAIAFFRFVITRRVPQRGTDALANAFHKKVLGNVGSFSACFTVKEIQRPITYSLSVDYSQHCVVAEKLVLGNGVVFSWLLNQEGFPIVSIRSSLFSSKDDRDSLIRKIDDYEAAKYPEETLLHALSATRKDSSKINGAESFFRPILRFFASIIIFSPMPHEYEDIKETLLGDDVNTDSVMRTLKQLGIKADRLSLEKVSASAFAEEAGISMQDLSELSVSLKKDLEEGENRNFIYLDRPFYYGLENDELTFYKLVLKYGQDVVLDFVSESSGNQKLINMAPIIFAGSPDDALFLIDEIDRSLHTSLVKAFIQLIIRANKSSLRQFIFTAHDPNLLDVDMFRKDELFFVENIDNQSRIVRLDKTGIRIDRDIRKKYIDGRVASKARAVIAEK